MFGLAFRWYCGRYQILNDLNWWSSCWIGTDGSSPDDSRDKPCTSTSCFVDCCCDYSGAAPLVCSGTLSNCSKLRCPDLLRSLTTSPRPDCCSRSLVSSCRYYSTLFTAAAIRGWRVCCSPGPWSGSASRFALPPTVGSPWRPMRFSFNCSEHCHPTFIINPTISCSAVAITATH